MQTLAALPIARPRRRAWLPAAWPVLLTAAVVLSANLAPWERMWLIAVALFAGFKVWTLRSVLASGVRTTPARAAAYLLLWPGMDARRFLSDGASVPRPRPLAWSWAAAKTILGTALLWLGARQAGNVLLAGWVGMIGLIFLLHFGVFALLALFWQRLGIDARPLMNCPIAAGSLRDFWGRRWNAGFRDIVYSLFFVRLARICGAGTATLLTFAFSGLLHELVITVPAGAGYGLPTLYFLLQGAAQVAERSPTLAPRLNGWRGRAFALAVVTLPIFALFPPAFVFRVMIPFFRVIHALP
ncbi:MAG: MBOAT family protein [Verrucomicrobiota bacterium]